MQLAQNRRHVRCTPRLQSSTCERATTAQRCAMDDYSEEEYEYKGILVVARVSLFLSTITPKLTHPPPGPVPHALPRRHLQTRLTRLREQHPPHLHRPNPRRLRHLRLLRLLLCLHPHAGLLAAHPPPIRHREPSVRYSATLTLSAEQPAVRCQSSPAPAQHANEPGSGQLHAGPAATQSPKPWGAGRGDARAGTGAPTGDYDVLLAGRGECQQSR